ERGDGKKDFAIALRRPDVLDAAHCGDKAVVRVLDSLGKSSGAAAEQQGCGVRRRGGASADRWLGLGAQLRNGNVLPQADHAGNAQIGGEAGVQSTARAVASCSSGASWAAG